MKVKHIGACVTASALVVLSLPTAFATSSAEPLKPLANIPVALKDGLPTTEVRIAGRPVKLFLDLGGFQAITLTSEQLETASVRFVDRFEEYRNAYGGAFKARSFVARDVNVGGASLGDIEGGEIVFTEGHAPPVKTGYLGMRLLGRFLLVLDYPSRYVRLYASGNHQAFARECGQQSFQVLTVNEVAQSVVFTEYGKLLFEWDTGATHDFIRPSRQRPEMRRGDGSLPGTTLRKFVLGRHDYGPLRFNVLDFSAPAVDGILGTDFLETRKVCLDIKQGKGAIAVPDLSFGQKKSIAR